MSHLQVPRRQPPAAYGGGEAGVLRVVRRLRARWLTTLRYARQLGKFLIFKVKCKLLTFTFGHRY